MEMNLYKYKGVIHIHTNSSDGTGDLKSVVSAAKVAGLDWIIITDHNHYDTEEGIFDGVYVIKGEEISPQNSDHYLAFGICETILPSDNPQEYINKVRELGGFGFAAHPDEGYTVNKKGEVIPRKNSNHCIKWTDKNIKPDGIEIWNWFSNWADNLDDSNLFTLAYSYLFKHKTVTNPSELTLKWWDKLNNETENIVPALGGVDAHALKIYKYIVPVTVFPYKTCFSTITNTIGLKEELSPDFQRAKEQILNAVKSGNNIIQNRRVSKITPEIYITNSDGKYYCGEDVKIDKNSCLHFYTTNKTEVCLIYNGEEIERYYTDKFVYPLIKSGKYRLEAFYKGKGFLYTNPFNVKN